MQDNSAENDELKIIKINSELYNSLREYCDKQNIRLIDFVEDSLGNTVDFYEQLKLLEENKKLLSQIREKHEKIYKAGFHEGFYIALYTLKGKIWAGLKNNTLKENLERNTPKLVEGPQLKLF